MSDGLGNRASRYEVFVDAGECISSGKCVAAAPGFFVFDADELSSIDPAGPRPADDVLLRIARDCPGGAIRLRQDGADVEV